MHGETRPGTQRLSAALHIALWFVLAIWIVGLIALLVGAPSDMVLAAAVVGSGSAVVEWLAHRAL
jgi:hypothetical protein